MCRAVLLERSRPLAKQAVERSLVEGRLKWLAEKGEGLMSPCHTMDDTNLRPYSRWCADGAEGHPEDDTTVWTVHSQRRSENTVSLLQALHPCKYSHSGKQCEADVVSRPR